MPHFKAARLALWDSPQSVQCASLYSKDIHSLLITLSLTEFFWDETSRTWNQVPRFWLGLSPSTWVQDSIWGKWFQLPSMDYPLLQLFSCDKKISSICAFNECVSSKQEEPGQLQPDDLKLWHYISSYDHMPRGRREPKEWRGSGLSSLYPICLTQSPSEDQDTKKAVVI